MSGEDLNRHNRSQTTRIEYEWSSVAPSTAVLEAVAAAADCEPTDLDPLYEFVDPDALDQFVRSTASSENAGNTSISFSFDCYEVTVYSSGFVTVRSGAGVE
jgi:hypothetical protein